MCPPADFMFELSKREYDSLRCQIGTLKRGGHSKYLPFAFTEQGIAMLSGVLSSKRAVQVNIQIMRAFTRLREMLSTHKDLKKKIEAMAGANQDRLFQIALYKFSMREQICSAMHALHERYSPRRTYSYPAGGSRPPRPAPCDPAADRDRPAERHLHASAPGFPDPCYGRKTKRDIESQRRCLCCTLGEVSIAYAERFCCVPYLRSADRTAIR